MAGSQVLWFTAFAGKSANDGSLLPNHIIDWDQARILDRDANPFSRKICECVEIHKKGTMAYNRSEGVYTLDHVYDSLLKSTSHPGKETTISLADFPAKAVNQSTCDQAIRQDGKSFSVSNFFF